MAPYSNTGDSQSDTKGGDFAKYVERLEQPLCVSIRLFTECCSENVCSELSEPDVSQRTVMRWVLKAQQSCKYPSCTMLKNHNSF